MSLDLTLPIGAKVRTSLHRFGSRTIVGTIIARRRGWFGRERYLVEWRVLETWIEPADMGQYNVAKWRGLSRIYGASVAAISDSGGTQ